MNLTFHIRFSFCVNIAVALFIFAGVFSVSGAGLSDLEGFVKNEERSLANTKADSWTVVGKNIVVKGNVHIPYGNITVYADRAIVNTESKDIEAVGNIRMFRTRETKGEVTIDELARLRNMTDCMVRIDNYTIDPLGIQRIKVTIFTQGDLIRASKVSGNLSTGFLSFRDFECKYKTFACKAKSGERKPGGEIIVRDAKISSCDFLDTNQAHYSIDCSEAKIYPYAQEGFGLAGYNPDFGDHSVWAYGCTVKAYDIPFLWVPMFYKPKDESPGLFKIRGGYTSDWGYFVSMSKKFHLLDDPYTNVTAMLDYYSLRGVGYGAEVDVRRENTKTNFWGYGIYDQRPYNTDDIEDTSRLEIPNARYGFNLSNVTHVTPKLDFRGNLSISSDYYFLNDYFSDKYNANPEPATYGALEQQFDRFSTALYVRARTNTFYTATERLPEWRLDVPRQELFDNLYYQGENSVAVLRMMWRDFDKPRTTGNDVDPRNYMTQRVDSLHMLYYPLKMDWLNLVPRAGLRMTYYNNTSNKNINETDFQNLLTANSPDQISNVDVVNYDHDGGSKFRVIGEAGLEASTKIHNSWQNVKNAYWEMDGLRHVFQPYVNYTGIPKPTTDRENLYYFDDIDRIQEQNFVRLGMLNRLQTRKGNYGSERIYNWMSMENYWDYHFTTQDGLNNIGDFVTKLDFSPFEDVNLSTLASFDVGDDKESNVQTNANGPPTNNNGLNIDFLNKWEVALRYKIIEGVNTNFAYVYQRVYKTQSIYSMGSTFSEIQSGNAFDQYYNNSIQQLRWGFDFPLFDNKSKFAYELFYDFEAGYLREQKVKITRNLHCVEVALEVGRTTSEDSSNNKQYDNSFMITATLVNVDSPLKDVNRNNMQSYGTGDAPGGKGSNNVGFGGG